MDRAHEERLSLIELSYTDEQMVPCSAVGQRYHPFGQFLSGDSWSQLPKAIQDGSIEAKPFTHHSLIA